MVQLIKSALCIFCIIGCYYQLQATLSTYLNYQTISETRTFVPHILFEPDSSVCIRYVDIVDVKVEDIYNPNLTLKEIFDHTPDKLISECYIRLKPTRMVINYRNGDCLKYFTINKYFTQEYICYRISPEHQYLSYKSYTSSLWYPHTIYWIYFDPDLAKKIIFVKPFAHGPGLPLESSNFAQYFHRRSENESVYMITYSVNHYKHLGYPFENFICGTPGYRAICQANCTTQLSLNMFGKLLYDVVFDKPMNYHILSGHDTKEPGVMDKIQHIHEYCDKMCKYRDCHGNFTLSTVSVSTLDKFIMKVSSPNCPDIEKISVPKVSHLDFIVYVMSALGTWFGFVVIDIDIKKYFISFEKCNRYIVNKYLNVQPLSSNSDLLEMLRSRILVRRNNTVQPLMLWSNAQQIRVPLGHRYRNRPIHSLNGP